MSKYYHATDSKGFIGILRDGEIKPGIDGVVYLADSFENANKFVGIRMLGTKESSYVIEVDVDDVEESFDHNEGFFGCKAYTYDKSIPIDNMSIEAKRYDYE